MIRFRALLIAAGYADANDCDTLRSDPAFKLAVGRLPESGRNLCSQPTMCRLENLPSRIALIRMMDAMIELFCDSFEAVPRRLVLDIDDTGDRVHGGQQMALFNAHHDGYCFMPIHIYEAQTGKPVAVVFREGKTPDGTEVARVLRHVVKAIRRRFPKVDIVIRGDSHYGRHEAMTWLERNRVAYVFGLAGNSVLRDRTAAIAECAAVERAEDNADKVRQFTEFRYAAKSWKTERKVIARIEATTMGSDTRYIVTNLQGTTRWLYETVYCARGQAENLPLTVCKQTAAGQRIKAHKLHLASDRTSCHGATANQFRLLVHTAAYWLLLELKNRAPKTSFWRHAQFDTIRLAIVKIAARVTEMVTRIKISLPSSYPDKADLSMLADKAVAAQPP